MERAGWWEGEGRVKEKVEEEGRGGMGWGEGRVGGMLTVTVARSELGQARPHRKVDYPIREMVECVVTKGMRLRW